VAEHLKSLNQPVTPKRAAAVIGALVLLGALVFGGRALWRTWDSRPKSSASVQDEVRNYLKEHASPKDLKSDYDFNLRTALAPMQTNAARMREEVANLRTNLVQAQQEMSALAREVKQLTGQQRAARRGELTNAQPASTNVAEILANRQTALAAKQNEIKGLREKLNQRDAEAAAFRREFAPKEQALANQHQNFTRYVRTNVLAAGSYEAIYTWIGRLLWTADRLLASSDFADQRAGAMLAEDAATYSIHNAENYWLAARISEGWLWPCVEKYDAPGKPKIALNQVLQTSADAFTRAGETNKLIKNFELRLNYAPNSRAADGVRYNLAGVLEQSGRLKEALDLYSAIGDTNYAAYAQRRIALIAKRTKKS
jgi:hypothetical protein